MSCGVYNTPNQILSGQLNMGVIWKGQARAECENEAVAEYCYIFSSCLRRCRKGWRRKTSSEAFRKQIAEVSTPCSFPPSPPTPLHPRRGDEVSSTALCGQRFVRGGVHVQTPTFKLAGNKRSDKRGDAACVHFESWRLRLNSTTFNTRPHRAVGSPFPPGGAGEGLGVRVGVAAQELLHFR